MMIMNSKTANKLTFAQILGYNLGNPKRHFAVFADNEARRGRKATCGRGGYKEQRKLLNFVRR